MESSKQRQPQASPRTSIRSSDAYVSPASAWPAEIQGLGKRRGGQPFARCGRCMPSVPSCLSWTFVRYGDVALCLKHAKELAKEHSRGV